MTSQLHRSIGLSIYRSIEELVRHAPQAGVRARGADVSTKLRDVTDLVDLLIESERAYGMLRHSSPDSLAHLRAIT
jgi:hypothetical protein